MFQEILDSVVSKVRGSLGAIIMDFEGITVDALSTGPAPLDITTVGMELSVPLRELSRAFSVLEQDALTEIVLGATDMQLIVRLLSPEYFVLLAVEPSALLGQARHHLRIASPKLLQALS